MSDRSESLRRQPKRTPKRRVLAKYPKAVANVDKYGRFEIIETRLLGSGQKERDAWEDAARRL